MYLVCLDLISLCVFIGKDLASGRDVGGGSFRDKRPTSLSGALWYSNEQPSSNMSELSYGALKKQGTWSLEFQSFL